MSQPKDSRNLSIDLLRIISMLMICLIHVNSFTQSHIKIVDDHYFSYYFSVYTQAVGFICVNLFALITGYVMLESKWKLSRLIHLYFLVIFYSVVLLCGYLCLQVFFDTPDPAELVQTAKKVLFKLPCGSHYWYFAAYCALYLLLPFINPVLLKLDQSKFTKLVFILTIVFTFANIRNGGIFYSRGYNATWLTVMYTLGAYIRRFPITISTKSLLTTAVSCTLIPLLFALCLPSANGKFLFLYPSPVITLYAFCFFVILLRLKIHSVFFGKVISFLAPMTFSVYLIHTHEAVWNFEKSYFLKWYIDNGCPWWASLVIAPAIYITCSAIDWLRIKLFNVCNVKQMADTTTCYAERMAYAVFRRLGLRF